MPRPLTEEMILAWADAWHAREGKWPISKSGQITDAPGENWLAINMALTESLRGLPGNSSLPRLLAERRGRRNHRDLQILTEDLILMWADGYHERTGDWPSRSSGKVADAAGETWNGVENATEGRGQGSTTAVVFGAIA